jgi:hypothetical protein
MNYILKFNLSKGDGEFPEKKEVLEKYGYSAQIDPSISEQSDPLVSAQTDPLVSDQTDPLLSTFSRSTFLY